MTVIPLRNQDNLAIVAARLKRAAPNAWGEFVASLEALYSEAATLCVQAPADQILMRQGRAQQLGELALDLKSCIETAEKLEAKMKERK